MIRLRRCIAFFFAAMLAACTQAPLRDADKRAAATAHDTAQDKAPKPKPDYLRYVQGPAMAFDFNRVSDWDSPDPSHVVVWTSPYEAYLLTLASACFNLASSQTILLSSPGRMHAGTDAVLVSGERCPVQRIDRLDARKLKADTTK